MHPLLTSKRLVMAGVVSGSLIAGGVVGAIALGPNLASAQTSTPSASTTPAPPGVDGSNSAPAMPPHGGAAHENAETAVTGDNATKAQAAAVKAVGGGTAGAVTSDFTKNGYEVTVTKSDGSTVEVHLDSSFNVMQGHGPGGPHADNDNDADDAPSSTGG